MLLFKDFDRQLKSQFGFGEFVQKIQKSFISRNYLDEDECLQGLLRT